MAHIMRNLCFPKSLMTLNDTDLNDPDKSPK